MADEKCKCLWCGPGAKVPAKELYGSVYKEVNTCIHYKVTDPNCGSCSESDLCVCVYCGSTCPCWGYHMFACYTGKQGDCYFSFGPFGNSWFSLLVVDKDTVKPNNCDTAKRVPPKAPAAQEMEAKS